MGEFVRSVLGDFIVQAALLLVSGLLIPLLVQAIGNIRDQRIRGVAVDLVRMAQQTIPSKSARYDYAAARLKERFPMLNQTQVLEAIEAAVHAVKSAQVPAPKAPEVRLHPPTINIRAGGETKAGPRP